MKHFLALGDSYTIGEAVAAAARWPVQLADRLREEGAALAPPLIVAQTGWTTEELRAGIAAADLQPGYDLVSLLIGVNNQYRGLAAAAYRLEFEALLATAVSLAGDVPERVMVLSIPDWGGNRLPGTGTRPKSQRRSMHLTTSIRKRRGGQGDGTWM